MALIGEIQDTVGWDLEDVVVVYTPTFTDALDTYTSFDWFSQADAAKLTAAVLERVEAAGYTAGTYGIVTPSAGSADASDADTWAALQSFFTGGGFYSAVSDTYNSAMASAGDLTGYLCWGDLSTANDWGADATFEAFCKDAGLTDGTDWGFRYIDSSGQVVYPNAPRTVQTGDVFKTPAHDDIYLDDLLSALAAIKRFAFVSPDNVLRGGPDKFSWSSLALATGSGSGESDDKDGWGGTSSVEMALAVADFGEAASTPTRHDGALATTTSKLWIDSFMGTYMVDLDSLLHSSPVRFTPNCDGSFVVHVHAIEPSGGTFHALGSGLSEGWTDWSPGSGTQGVQITTPALGATAMDTDHFPTESVPNFGLSVVANGDDSGDEPFDWIATGEVAVTYSGGSEDITGNQNMSVAWLGDLSANPADVYQGVAYDLTEGTYTAEFEATLYSESEVSAQITCIVSAVTPSPSPSPHPHPCPHAHPGATPHPHAHPSPSTSWLTSPGMPSASSPAGSPPPPSFS